MRKNFLFLFALLSSIFVLGRAEAATVTDPVVIEITDTTLSSVYYHQQHFDVPTKLVFTNLTQVSGQVYFHQNVNLVEVDFPVLTQTGNYFYFYGNANLVSVNAPNLQTVSGYVYAGSNASLTSFNTCNLTGIVTIDPWSEAYYYFEGNTPAVDSGTPCFSLGGPQNFALSNHSIAENQAAPSLVGTLSADSNYPSGTLTYYIKQYTDDYNLFSLSGNQLLANASFDYEAHHEYHVTIGVRNQLGEKLETSVTINVLDVSPEALNVITITDTTLDQVYYSQQSFASPTKIVFPNLTTVTGGVYFERNINLVEVDFPVLTQTGGSFYFNVNLSLETVNAPNLHTVNRYVYAASNPALAVFDICGLTQILSDDSGSAPYYYFYGNTAAVDNGTPCFSLGGPQNFALSGTVVAENSAIGTVVGNLSADSNYPSGTLTYFMEDYVADNHLFKLVGNQLIADATFDYESRNNYVVKVGVRNQLGENVETEFTINITDVNPETLTTIVITDATLDNIYYHQYNFTGPTKLVFANLTSVGGMIYFDYNINLVEVDFPVLTQTGNYFYFYGNPSLVKIDAPNLQTVHNYLYVTNHVALTELNVCGLEEIVTLTEYPAYYYIESNPNLNLDTTCLADTTFGFAPEPEIVVQQTPNTLVGTFTTDADVPLDYFFTDADGNPTANTDFIIANNGLYLAHDADYYEDATFNIHVGAIRMASANRSTGRSSDNGLNEKLQLAISLNVSGMLATKAYGKFEATTLSPNPARDYFELGVKGALTDVAIFDMAGRQLQGFSVNANRVDVANLPNGNYIVRANAGGKTFAKKLVIKK